MTEPPIRGDDGAASCATEDVPGCLWVGSVLQWYSVWLIPTRPSHQPLRPRRDSSANGGLRRARSVRLKRRSARQATDSERRHPGRKRVTEGAIRAYEPLRRPQESRNVGVPRVVRFEVAHVHAAQIAASASPDRLVVPF